ncbi:MAG: hypothetical protein OXG51_10835 [Gammaproteobacteria bacterium]|nr:hypothetical protein [Gammaproteobacteria bacterium]
MELDIVGDVAQLMEQMPGISRGRLSVENHRYVHVTILAVVAPRPASIEQNSAYRRQTGFPQATDEGVHG